MRTFHTALVYSETITLFYAVSAGPSLYQGRNVSIPQLFSDDSVLLSKLLCLGRLSSSYHKLLHQNVLHTLYNKRIYKQALIFQNQSKKGFSRLQGGDTAVNFSTEICLSLTTKEGNCIRINMKNSRVAAEDFFTRKTSSKKVIDIYPTI